jgi:hypothetical protein
VFLFFSYFTPDEPQYMQDVVQDMRNELRVDSIPDPANGPSYEDSAGMWADEDEDDGDDVIRAIRQEIRELGPQKMLVPISDALVLLKQWFN